MNAPSQTITASRWPATLWIVRHGQSAGNVARDIADEQALARIALTHRDVDVPLSPLGCDQARALGHWFNSHARPERPDVVLTSPYLRAIHTAELFQEAGGCSADTSICLDERLREKEFGILDGLTRIGIEELHPEQANFRDVLGKFYHRPPGGESWVDVIFRLRALMDTVSLHYAGQRVMIFAHQVVVLCLRYILENMTEAEILEIDRAGEVVNCGITEYRLDRGKRPEGKLRLARYNFSVPLEEEGTTVTAEPDQMVAARG